MRILLINKFFWRKGGSEVVFFGEKELLERNRHDVVPFSMKHLNNVPSEFERFFIENIDYEKNDFFAKFSLATKIIYSFEAVSKIKNLLEKKNFDIAHLHIFQHQISPSIFGPLKNKGIPLILTLHDLKPICPNYKMLVKQSICERCKDRKFYNCLLHKCSKGSLFNSLINTIEMYFHYAMGYYQGVDQYIAVSRFYRDKMIEFGFEPRQISYVPNYIDASFYQPVGQDYGYGLYFGRLSEEKGCMTLLQALKLNPDLPFLFIGTGPQEEALKKKAAELNLLNVKFLGFKSGEELKKLIGEAAFVVIPSEWYENCPMSVLESFSMAKPVIGANIGGIPELIEDGEDGLTFEAGNAEQLALRIRELSMDATKRELMGKAGRRKVQLKFNPDLHYERLMEVYKAVQK
ncbi:MAG: glycosyltransferase family 4 protein [Syntrophotaleaceae bacterium]